MPAATNPMIADFIKAQQSIEGLEKNASNPHFRNKFLNLEGLLKAVLPPLHANNFGMTQTYVIPEDDTKPAVLVTTLHHVSGDTITSDYPLLVTDGRNPQQMGSAGTYARRYALQALMGVVGEEDDDGNAAAGVKPKPSSSRSATARPASTGGASDRQLAAAKVLLKEVHGANSAAAGNKIVQAKFKKDLTELTGAEISALIDELQAQQTAATATDGPPY